MTHRWTTRALFLIGLLLAPAWAGAAAAQGAGPQSGGPAMWTLTADKATVYFLGSFHILPPGIAWREDSRIETALSEAAALLFEVDLDDMDKPEVAASIVRRATLPGGKTLRDVLTPETYGALQSTAGRYGMDMAMLEPMQPWLAASGLLVGYMVSKGADPASGVDSQLTRDARAAGKAVIPLETIDGQLDVLESLSREDPDLMITDMIRFLDDTNGLLSQTLTAWQTGDTQAIDALIREDLGKHEGVYDRFLTNRNMAWVPKIEALIGKGGTYFVVVGAGHLVGDQSVIAMLRAKGYAIERY
ncbi:TraB/GumN family protein [Emcibacter sp. SYSU 3D8]|uniref:TraB/GumN family protein n=1 Tax=Emcibacter sp. SYSU 3D8 TaxID=3133969 RepID=UPI0031FEEF8F